MSLLPARCPGARDLAIWTNTAARTISSGGALAQGIAPDCHVAVGHLPTDQVDPFFEPLRTGAIPFDGVAALASVRAYTGGAAAQARRYRAPCRRCSG
jgi:4-phytase/acid phosphatase